MRVELLSDVENAGATVHVLVRLHATARAVGERSPVNLALVIDRSSSMRGPRIAQALRAAQQVVEQLDGRDRLSIVTFDASARAVFGPCAVTDDVRASLARALAEIDTGVGTNLAAGIKKGAEAIRSGFVRDAVSRLVMLTDGQPSVGITDGTRLGAIAEKEALRGVSITTMGLGEGFDDELLAELASRGRGGFYYLASAADIPAAFGRELAGVFSIAARDTELKLLPGEDVLAAEVLHRLPSRPLDDGLAIEIGEVAANSPRQVLFRLTRRPNSTGTHCGTLAVSYRNADGSAGDGHILGIELPSAPLGSGKRDVTSERLRLEAAAAVDVAWARRASGDSHHAIAVLAEVRKDVTRARDQGALAPEDADELLADMAAAEKAVAKSSAERDKIRRSLRERSHITMLGHSTIRRLPTDDDAT